MSPPLVGIGLPVRNGERSIGKVLESLARQTLGDFAVTIVDNCSEDATASIAKQFCAGDSRFRYVRQAEPVTMWRNFERAYRESEGRYLVFAADDLYPPDWLETLVGALESDSRATLAFGEQVMVFRDYADPEEGDLYDVRLSTERVPRRWRLVMDRHSGYAVCGVFRRDALDDYGWMDHSTSPDWPLLTYAMLRGEVIAVPGPLLYVPRDDAKGGRDRIVLQSYGHVERFPALSLAIACADAAAAAEHRKRDLLWNADVVWLLLAFARQGVVRRIRLRAQRAALAK